MIVAKDFFWLGEKGDRADKKRPGIDNLTRAMNLDAKDGSGWEALTGYAADPTGMPLPDKKDTICAPADPVFDIKQLENLAKETGTERSGMGLPGATRHRGARRRAAQRAGGREARHALRPRDGGRRAGAAAEPDTDAQGGRAVRQGRLRAGRRRSARSATTSFATRRTRRAGRSRASSAASSKPASISQRSGARWNRRAPLLL